MAKIEVDTSEVRPDKPSHTPWIPEGDTPAEHCGHYDREGSAVATRSTGTRPNDHALVLPTMSVVMPA